MDTVENTSVPKVAYQRYQTTLEEYKEALRADAGPVTLLSFSCVYVNTETLTKQCLLGDI